VTAAVQQLRPASADLDTVLADDIAHLARSPLAATSRDANRKRVAGFLRWLLGQDEHGPEAPHDPLAREHALRDYLRHLRVELHRPPTTCNAHLAAVNRFWYSSTATASCWSATWTASPLSIAARASPGAARCISATG